MTVHQGLLWIVQQDSDSFGHYWLHVVDMGSFAGRKLRFLHQDVWGLGSDGAQMYSMARESKGFVAEVSPFAPIPEQGIVLGNPLRQEFVLTYTFVKKSGGTYNLDAYTPYPSDMPFQHVFDIKVSPAPTETLVDTFGNRWMHFKLRAQNKSAAITLRFGIETMAAAFTLRTSKDAKGLDQAAEQLYTKATSAFDYRDPAFAKVTMAHTGADAVARITDIHDFVNDALRVVGPSGPETSASEFLTKGIGRCYAHTLVFAAIARRDGLATRAVGGIALKAVDVPAADPAVHTWDQVYLPGSGWMDVDVVADQTESGKPARHEMIGYHRNACFLTFQGNYDKFNGKDLFAERNWYMHRTYESVDKKNPVELTGGQITSQVSDLVLAKP
jgi:transglutaminase-like putative cysteine protease